MSLKRNITIGCVLLGVFCVSMAIGMKLRNQSIYIKRLEHKVNAVVKAALKTSELKMPGDVEDDDTIEHVQLPTEQDCEPEKELGPSSITLLDSGNEVEDDGDDAIVHV
jgi:hypothetical protein